MGHYDSEYEADAKDFIKEKKKQGYVQLNETMSTILKKEWIHKDEYKQAQRELREFLK